MEVLDIVLEIPYILPPTIVMSMVFMMMKVLKCLKVMLEVYIGLLKPETINITIV